MTCMTGDLLVPPAGSHKASRILTFLPLTEGDTLDVS